MSDPRQADFIAENRLTLNSTDVCWDVAQAARAQLSQSQRNVLFSILAVEEPIVAMRAVLTALIEVNGTLPVSLVTRVAQWLERYSGTDDEILVRDLLVRTHGHSRHHPRRTP